MTNLARVISSHISLPLFLSVSRDSRKTDKDTEGEGLRKSEPVRLPARGPGNSFAVRERLSNSRPRFKLHYIIPRVSRSHFSESACRARIRLCV
jgi:hypothetical protein